MVCEKRGRNLAPILIRIIWMLVFAIAWMIGEIVLVLIVIVQLIRHIIWNEPVRALQRFGDSLSQYMAGIGRFATFSTEEKPWPLSDWPAPRGSEGEASTADKDGKA